MFACPFTFALREKELEILQNLPQTKKWPQIQSFKSKTSKSNIVADIMFWNIFCSNQFSCKIFVICNSCRAQLRLGAKKSAYSPLSARKEAGWWILHNKAGGWQKYFAAAEMASAHTE